MRAAASVKQPALGAARRLARIGSGRRQSARAMAPPLPDRDLGHSIGSQTPATTLTVWLDYSCPFSTKSFNTLYKQAICCE